MTAEHDRFRDWDAAYVLGMLGAEDRRAFELHLKTCAVCAGAVSELAGMPALLGAISAEQAVGLASGSDLVGIAHEPSLLAPLARRVARRRLRRRIIGGFAGIVAACLLVVAGAAFSAPAPSAAPSAATTESAFTPMTVLAASTMSAKLRITEKGWGTRLEWVCNYYGLSSYAGEYEIDATTTDGKQHVLASWSTTGGSQSGELSASTSLRTAEIDRIDIRIMGAESALVETRL